MGSTTSIDIFAPPLIDDDADQITVGGGDVFSKGLSTDGAQRDDAYLAGLKPVLETVRNVIPCRYVVYRGFDVDRREIKTLSGCGLPEDFPPFAAMSGNICYETLLNKVQQTAVVRDLHGDGYAASDPDVRRYKLKTYLGAAVKVNEAIIGALAVFDDQSDRFDISQVQTLEIMAHSISLVEEHRLVEVQLTRRINNSRLVAAVSAKAITASSAKFLSSCLKRVAQWARADAGVFFWMDHDSNPSRSKFEYWSRSPSAGKAVVEPQALMSLDIVLDVIEKQQPVFCSDKTILNGLPMQELFQRRDIASALFLPICSQKKLIGICCMLFGIHVTSWSQEDLGVLMTVMGIVAQWRETRSMSSELDESQALNKQMLQLSPAAIYRIDFRRNRLAQVNDYLCRYTGYSEEELLDMNPEEILIPESRAIYRQRCQDFIGGLDVPSSMEYQIQTKQGETEWARIHTRFIIEDGHVTGAIVVANHITEQKKIMQELDDYREKLETLVMDRTRALSETNQKLHTEIAIRTHTAKKLHLKSERLKELNTAMGVLLDKRNEDRLSIQENIRVNLRQLVEPYIERMAASGLNSTQRQLLEVIGMNINEVIGAPLADVSEKYYILSPSELQVANLIRNGKTTKDIARLLRLSSRTVESYRNSIRKKLGLKNRRVNLRTYLSSKD